MRRLIIRTVTFIGGLYFLAEYLLPQNKWFETEITHPRGARGI